MTDDTRKAFQLCLMALVNYLLFYGLGVFLARQLDVRGFEQYSVAVATVTLLASIATLGLEKYALRALPGYYAKTRWTDARGYTQFSLRTISVVGAAITLVYLTASRLIHSGVDARPRWVVLLATVIVPAVAVTMFLIEVLSANGKAVRASVVYRVLLPGATVLLVGAVYLSEIEFSARLAVLCYVVAWLICLGVIHLEIKRALPAPVLTEPPEYQPRKWLAHALPFLIQSFVMTQFASSGVIVLEFLHPDDFVVGLYAACLSIAGFAVLLATSTNRFYAPIAALMLERGDWNDLRTTARHRHRWLIPVTVGFAAVVLVFGKRILGFYGPEFEQGYPSLCIIVVGISVSVLFSMAPYVLNFMERSGLVLGIIVAAGSLNLILLFALGGEYGALGAAIAYSVSLSVMSLAFVYFALRLLRRQASQAPATASSDDG